MFSPSSVSVLLVFNIIHTIVFATPASLTSDCKPCHSEIVCPQSDADCESGTRVSDPCACCIDGICPQLETEHCSFDKPCERGYACVKANGDEETSCRCRRDKRAVCGSDNTTYISICSLQRQPHKPSLLKWGHCDKAPEIVSASGDIVVLEGQPMALDCEVKGNPIPSINWYFTSLDGATKLLPSKNSFF
ncbi:hypothetical protein O3M35_006008 [Rhynocoris fuscipes]|uniref:Uncharacterized protein n=1 Tax=Rhynocoris fuscipes TaxID=488301 RepID=A0AAW1DEE1_9HEMI